ncbi:MAG: hypothetical protein AAFN10_14725 [Bacteroidota bacterium]
MLAPEINHAKLWKYAQKEWERRFLLRTQAINLAELSFQTITDKYLDGTRLRLRKTQKEEKVQFKLTKKLELSAELEDWVSTIYLSESEYALFYSLAGKSYEKRRYYREQEAEARIGIDAIRLGAEMIYLAEVEFDSPESMMQYQFPLPFAKEVTNDPFYSGFAIAQRSSL